LKGNCLGIFLCLTVCWSNPYHHLRYSVQCTELAGTAESRAESRAHEPHTPAMCGKVPGRFFCMC